MIKFSKWNYYACNVVYLTSIMILFINSVTHYQDSSNITFPIIGTNLKEAFTEGYLTNKSIRDQKTIFKQEYSFTVQY